MITVRYKVEFYDPDEYRSRVERGIVGAVDYNDMMKKLHDYYGEGNVVTVSFYDLYDLMCDEDIRETLDSDSE